MSKVRIPKGPYCYALSDECGNVFYIGKGRGNRLYQHEREARRGALSEKHDRIRGIVERGYAVTYSILGEYEDDASAYQAERNFIAAHSGLTNIASGGGAMPVSPKERMRRRAAEMLRQLKPRWAWMQEMTEYRAHMAERMFGSLDACYDFFETTLRSNAECPDPNVLFIKSDGTSEWGWA